MRLLATLLLLCSSAFGAYVSQRSITIDHTQAGTADSSNFTFKFVTQSTFLNGALNNSQTNVTVFSGKAIANGDTIKIDSEKMLVGSGGGTTALTVTRATGGTSAATHADKAAVLNTFLSSADSLITSSSGFDVVFTTTNTCATLLNFELEDYNTTGDGTWHVQITTLSHTVDTVVYVCYNNSSITTNQSNNNATWDTNFKRVHHLAAGAPEANTLDSTGNNNLNTGGTALTTSHMADGGSKLTTQSSGLAAGLVYGAGARTTEAWLEMPACTGTQHFTQYGTNTALNAWDMYILCASNSFNFDAGVIAVSGNVCAATFSPVVDPNWGYFVATYDGTNIRIYVDGVKLNTCALALNTTNTSSFNFTINPTASDRAYDEIRFSNVQRSDSYVTATYNAYKTSSTFSTLSVGSPPIKGYIRHRVINN